MTTELTDAKRSLKNHLSCKPTITGMPGFSVKAHIKAVDHWLSDKHNLEKRIAELEAQYEPDATSIEDAYSRRKRLWEERHYPESTGE